MFPKRTKLITCIFSLFSLLGTDRLSPPLDIQLETINCSAFSVRWKMPRRHVSTITGYKVVISCVKAGDRWQQESPHKGEKSRQKWEKISSKLKVCTCSFLLRPCIRKKVVGWEKKPLWCIRRFIFLCFYGQMSIFLLVSLECHPLECPWWQAL